MLDVIFYLQVAFFAVLLLYGFWSKSPAVFALAGVFSILTGVMLVGEGLDIPTGYEISGADDNVMQVSETYSTYFTFNSGAVNMWHYVLLYGGFVWLIVAAVLAKRGHEVGVDVGE